jgi:hypothetical protein
VAGLLNRCDPLRRTCRWCCSTAPRRGRQPRRRLAHRTLDQPTLSRLVALSGGALPMVYDTDDRDGVLHHEAGCANSVLLCLDRRRATVGAING